MIIYVYAEYYPSPYKPYFDTQFIQFLKDGHQLRIFANGYHEGPLHPKFREFKLDRFCSYFPVTLKHLPRHFFPAFATLLMNPWRRGKLAVQIIGGPGRFKERLMDFFKMMRLPLAAPQLCLVHNLLTMHQLRFLKRLYPQVVVALHFHGGEIPGVPMLNNKASKSAFASADIVFTNTWDSRRHAIERGCPREKIRISQVGFSCEDFNPRPNRTYRKGGVLHLLFMGRLSPEKGIKDIFSALTQLKEQRIPFKLKLVGSGPSESDLREYASILEIEFETEFVGPVAYERIGEYLEWADALVLSSIPMGNCVENQACVTQEAMLMKTIVVTSATGGVPESIPEVMRRFQYPPGDASALQSRLADLAGMNGEEMAELGRIGREFVMENYEISDLNRRLLKLALRDSQAGADTSASEYSQKR